MGRVINDTNRQLRSYSREQELRIKNLIADTAVSIEIEAQRNAPRDKNEDLFIVIDKKFRNKGLEAEVGVMNDNNLAAYFEFGTGLSARKILQPYPDWVKRIALEFYVTGRGTLKGKPYLYPAVFRNMKEFNLKLRRILREKWN